MALIPWPAALKLRDVSWRQDWPRLVQKSEFSGRTRVASFGSAPRWTAECSFPQMRSARTLRSFLGNLAIPGNVTRLVAVEGSQHGAADNLVQNGAFASGVLPWTLGAGCARVQLASNTGLQGPAEYGLSLGTASSLSIANVPATSAISAATRLFLSAWVLDSSAQATGNSSLFAEWLDGAAAQIAFNTVSTSPVPGQNAIWRLVRGYLTAPSGTVSVRVGLANDLTANNQWMTLVRASLLPSSAAVVLSGSTPNAVNVSGLAISAVNLPEGSLVTVALPNGDEQLAALAAPLVGDGSGNGTLLLNAPLRDMPVNGAIVELALPYALMRAGSDILSWAAQPGGIYGAPGFTFEEAF